MFQLKSYRIDASISWADFVIVVSKGRQQSKWRQGQLNPWQMTW